MTAPKRPSSSRVHILSCLVSVCSSQVPWFVMRVVAVCFQCQVWSRQEADRNSQCVTALWLVHQSFTRASTSCATCRHYSPPSTPVHSPQSYTSGHETRIGQEMSSSLAPECNEVKESVALSSTVYHFRFADGRNQTLRLLFSQMVQRE